MRVISLSHPLSGASDIFCVVGELSVLIAAKTRGHRQGPTRLVMSAAFWGHSTPLTSRTISNPVKMGAFQ